MGNDKLIIFDTTLRDGAQTPGVLPGGKFELAKSLAYTGVDVIEAGFAKNTADYDTIVDIARYIGSREHSKLDNVPQICSLARVSSESNLPNMKNDINMAMESIRYADPDKRRLHVFIGTSRQLQTYSHGNNESQIIEKTKASVGYSREILGSEGTVEYSPEDGTRTKYDFLAKIVEVARSYGADVINIPDTTGGATPRQYHDLIRRLLSDVEILKDAIISTHIHNDTGNAVACAMEGINAGARQVEGCVLGLGERAGNTDWMTVVLNVMLHDEYDVDISHLKTEKFYKLAELASNVTGVPIPLNYPGTGRNAFTTSSGIHVNALIKDDDSWQSYYLVNPKVFGRKSHIVFGPTSGTHTTESLLENKDASRHTEPEYSKEEIAEITEVCKRKLKSMNIGILNDTELRVIAEDVRSGQQENSGVKLLEYSAPSSDKGNYSELTLDVRGKKLYGKSRGEGTVDAMMNALNEALGAEGEITLDYWDQKAVYRGRGAHGSEILDEIEFSDEELMIMGNGGNGYASKDQGAIAKCIVKLKYRGETYDGRAESTDTTRASYEAIIDALDAMAKLGALDI